MIGIDFLPTSTDPCVYTYGRGSTLTILTFYVDDILRSGYNQKGVQLLKKELMNRIAVTGMCEVSVIFGMSVFMDHNKGTLTISQADYLHNVIVRFGTLECNTVQTPEYGPELSNE